MNQLTRKSTGLDSPALAPGKSRLTAGVIVCTLKRPELLRKCLEGIKALEPAPDEVIVVDNSEGDSETQAVAREFGAIYTVEPRKGLSRARNRGLAESRSEIVAFIDDDATPDVRWLGALFGPFEDPNVTTVTGRIITPASRPVDGVRGSARSLSNKDPEWFGIATYGGLGLGSNMAFRRQACAGQKIFDERLGRGAPLQIAEENYAFALLLSRGHTAVYLPDAIVFHPALTTREIKLEARNSIAFFMVLFSEFPGHRLELLQFLYRRFRRKPLAWPRETPDPGEIITSGWWVLIRASFSAALLFLRTRRS